MTLIYIFLIIWFIGVIVAWFQLKRWFSPTKLIFPDDYIAITIMSLMSWAVYILRALEELCEHLKDK